MYNANEYLAVLWDLCPQSKRETEKVKESLLSILSFHFMRLSLFCPLFESHNLRKKHCVLCSCCCCFILLKETFSSIMQLQFPGLFSFMQCIAIELTNLFYANSNDIIACKNLDGAAFTITQANKHMIIAHTVRDATLRSRTTNKIDTLAIRCNLLREKKKKKQSQRTLLFT